METNKHQRGKSTNHQLETIGLMASGIVHDFNNLLTGIVGQTSLALANLPPDNEARKHIERVFKAAEFGTSLTNQLLTFANDQNLTVERVNMNDLISNIQPLFRMFLDHNIQLGFEFEGDIPAVLVIRSQIQQVMMNLVMNAVKAIGSSPGFILVRTSTFECCQGEPLVLNNGRPLIPGKYIRIEIDDNGIGIDPITMTKIFTPFYSKNKKGNGLGLTNSVEIVQQHNGGILINSQPNRGTNASIFLPICLNFPPMQ